MAQLSKKRVSRSFTLVAAVVLLLCLASPRAQGDVGIILNESLDTSMERITGSGHSAVYLSRICPASPLKLRLCRHGEEGSVISNYINLGEDQRFEWNIVPLSLYVYGVDDPRFRPVVGSEKVKRLLEDEYRDSVLSSYCSVESCMTSNKSEWREMVAAGMSRSMYVFVAETTLQQDLELIARFNALPNDNHFNGITNNCADFTKSIIDAYFPHSAHRDVVNDFGMTSPKAIARSFSHYAAAHPEMNFRVIHFSQVPGTFKRSSEARSGTEQLYRSKKLLIPMAVFADHELPAAAAAYLLTGRFNPNREFEVHPAIELVQAKDQGFLAKSDVDDTSAEESGFQEISEAQDIVGTPKEWKTFRKEFDSIIDEAVTEQVIPNRAYLDHFLSSSLKN